MHTEPEHTYTHGVSVSDLRPTEDRIAVALQNGGIDPGGLGLRDLAVQVHVRGLRDAADRLGIEDYFIEDPEWDGDGSITVVITFGRAADMVAFKLAVS